MEKENQNISFSKILTLSSKSIFKIFSLLTLLCFCSCNSFTTLSESNLNYKQEMRNYVQELSNYSKTINPNFIIIPQNGVELLTNNGEDDDIPNSEYIEAIDGIGQEDLYYGYNNDNQLSPSIVTQYLNSFLRIGKNSNLKILVTDYCSTIANINNSYNKNMQNGYVSFAADQRELDNIPVYPNPIINENGNSVISLENIENFLYLINPSTFMSKQTFINTVKTTNYDLLIMDYFFNDDEFTKSELNELRSKANGGKRLLISYMSIGEAEDYRYYWQSDWNSNPPKWLDKENPNWEGNFKVKYWEQDWKNIIYGSANSYLDKIIAKGFDGAYLDIIDAFEYFENQ